MLPRYSYDPARKDVDTRSFGRRCKLLLPWLNTDVLKRNPAVLYALLYYRTAYTPQDWAAFDSRQLTLSWACGWLDVDFSRKCVIMYGPRYGELVEWEEAAAHRADILGFPRARLVLEAQAYLLATLSRVVDQLLENVDEPLPPRTEKWMDLTAKAAFKYTGEVEFWSPYTNQALSPPPPAVLDIEHLLSLAKTRLDATADRLWNLQCDIATVRRYVKLVAENPLYRKMKLKTQVAAGPVSCAVIQDVFDHYWWRWLEMECRHVRELHRRFRDNIRPGHPLPSQYDRALGGLEILLVNQVIRRASVLGGVLPFSPGMSSHYKMGMEPGTLTTKMRLTRITPSNTQDSLNNDPLDWVLTQLLGKPDTQTHFDHALLFSLLQHHMSSDVSWKEKGRVDERIYTKLSDLATCHEMLVSVRLCRPQNRNRDIDDFKHQEDREGWKIFRHPDIDTPTKDHEKAGMKLVEHFLEPSTHKTSTKDTLLRSQKTRRTLEDFWVSMREIARQMLGPKGSFFSKQEVDSMIVVLSAHSTPEYLNDARAEEKALADIIQNERQPPRQTSFATVVGELDSKPNFASQARRDKTKSRPQPGEVIARIATPEPDPEPAPTLGTEIRVTQRAMDLIRHMYPQTSAEAAKSISWESFVQALCEVGFMARNNGGSAVLFEKISVGSESDDAGGKIVFHRPHPETKIDPVMLHAMGRRMTKWFGWARERFVFANQEENG
jgi:hypothetical protein